MNNQLSVNNTSLLLSFVLVLVAIGVSYKEKLGVTKDIFISVLRAIIQLTVIGYLLKYVFQTDRLFLTLAMTFFIILNASWNAYKRDPSQQKNFWHSFMAIALSTYLTLAVLLISGSLQFLPMQVIPITGMLASNSMVAIGLCYRNLNTQFRDQRQQVLEKLALGASVKLAAQSILRDSIKAAMIPSIDSAKTVGLVSLPGMMSGLILAGIDPVFAIKYQIMVTFMLLSATSLGAIMASYLSYQNYFNAQDQLIERK